MEQGLWCDQIVLAADRGSAGLARAFVTHRLVEHRLLYLVEEIRLVVSELATNAVVHAGTDFTVVLEEQPTSVLLTVSDGSPSAPRPLDIVPTLAVSGRGLHIVNILSQDWGFAVPESSTKSVWARFAKRPVAAT